eukprot:CAMPEP_0182831690 /NCGR_PEP_ID=MMETSP0006_2-20121128/19279_1 /TAXON_ID=97485 /ORGANISM="Prymnesium parvum, Strain Texoma1" /LENGTH=125 /DNA_ID=CAMNT_0024959413 /DNA_START=39 /DNA_END=413 /DNA_ORIENTATION=-
MAYINLCLQESAQKHAPLAIFRLVEKIDLLLWVGQQVVQLQRPPVSRMVPVRLVIVPQVSRPAFRDRFDLWRIDQSRALCERGARLAHLTEEHPRRAVAAVLLEHWRLAGTRREWWGHAHQPKEA